MPHKGPLPEGRCRVLGRFASDRGRGSFRSVTGLGSADLGPGCVYTNPGDEELAAGVTDLPC